MPDYRACCPLVLIITMLHCVFVLLIYMYYGSETKDYLSATVMYAWWFYVIYMFDRLGLDLEDRSTDHESPGLTKPRQTCQDSQSKSHVQEQ